MNIIEIVLLCRQVRKMAGVLNIDILIDHFKSTKRNASTVVELF